MPLRDLQEARRRTEAFYLVMGEYDAVVCDGGRVVSCVAMRGTHRGPWLGVPATGEPVAIRCVVMHRVADGRIVEDCVLTESLGLFQQLGLVDSREKLLAEASARRATTILSRG